jgi:hypothetical protein
MLQSLAAEFAITLTDGAVWLAIGQGLLFGGMALLFGTWVARQIGLLASGAPAGETLGVGLGVGLLVLTAWWAAIWSGGRSSFTPVAIGFAIAIALAVARRTRPHSAPIEPAGSAPAARSRPYRSLVLTILGGSAFIVVIALLYGATMAPSPRDGVQPVENVDEAYYAILGRDLAATGTETMYSTSGFTELPGLSAQTWYHSGELWLASAIITIFGTAPLAARNFVVLPVVLLAAAALTGTVVRRMAPTTSRQAYIFGFLACLFLAPVPVLSNLFLGGLISGITLYGVAAVAVLLVLYSLAVLRTRGPTWPLAGFVGSATAFILPAHVVLAALASTGVGSVWAIRIGRSLLRARRLPVVAPVWQRTLAATVILLATTVAWGLLTGHGVGSSGGLNPGIAPFNGFWRASLTTTALGAGAILAIPLAWLMDRKGSAVRADLYLGTNAVIIVGAAIWGARLGDFNMFHLFYGGIAIFAMPIAAVAVRVLWVRLRETGHLRLAAALAVVCVIQLELGAARGLTALQYSGPRDYPPIPVSLLGAIEQLPSDAKLAYACGQLEETGFAGSRLLPIDAHTGRRVVPMCFEADVVSSLLGATPSVLVPNPFFEWAPQRALYPNSTARPSSTAVAAFLKDHGIDYIYADAKHPNSLVVDAVPIATDGDAAVLRIP